MSILCALEHLIASACVSIHLYNATIIKRVVEVEPLEPRLMILPRRVLVPPA